MIPLDPRLPQKLTFLLTFYHLFCNKTQFCCKWGFGVSHPDGEVGQSPTVLKIERKYRK